MQDSLKMSFLSSRPWQNLFKVLLFIIVLWIIYLIIRQKGENIQNVWQQLQKLFSKNNIILLSIVLLLMPINWAFESLKWQKLVNKIEEISFADAYKATLAGLALANTTPFMAGDYAAKIWLLKSNRRAESFGAILLGNVLQMYASLFFGTFGYLYFVIKQNPNPLYLHLIFVSGLFFLLILGIFLVSKRSTISYIFDKIRWLKKFEKYWSVLEKYNSGEMLEAFLLAAARYLVFTAQFVLVLLIFQIHLPLLTLFAGVSLVFLAKTLIPFINFASDFGVRQVASFYYFGYYHVSLSGIATATTLVWLINILFPMFIGAIFVLKFRLTLKQ